MKVLVKRSHRGPGKGIVKYQSLVPILELPETANIECATLISDEYVDLNELPLMLSKHLEEMEDDDRLCHKKFEAYMRLWDFGKQLSDECVVHAFPEMSGKRASTFDWWESNTRKDRIIGTSLDLKLIEQSIAEIEAGSLGRCREYLEIERGNYDNVS